MATSGPDCIYLLGEAGGKKRWAGGRKGNPGQLLVPPKSEAPALEQMEQMGGQMAGVQILPL